MKTDDDTNFSTIVTNIVPYPVANIDVPEIY